MLGTCETARPVDKLTHHQRHIVQLITQGRSAREIAQELRIQPGSVKAALQRIYERVGMSNRVELATWALAFMPVSEPAPLSVKFYELDDEPVNHGCGPDCSCLQAQSRGLVNSES